MRLFLVLSGLALVACHRVEEASSDPAASSLAGVTAPGASAALTVSSTVPIASPSASASTSAQPAAPWPFPWPQGYTPPLDWETRTVKVDGVEETWTLRFRSGPVHNGCSPWTSCACDAAEWGLIGDLDLVRERPGEPIETFSLSKIRGDGVEIRGFVTEPDDTGLYVHDKEVRAPKTLADAVKRPHASTLALKDYDHDGRATEFVLRTDYWACGQVPSVLVGISRANPHLHVFTQAHDPSTYLQMTYLRSWELVREATGKSVTIEQTSCGDHGGGGEFVRVEFGRDGALSMGPDPDWICDFTKAPPVKRRTH